MDINVIGQLVHCFSCRNDMAEHEALMYIAMCEMITSVCKVNTNKFQRMLKDEIETDSD